jgi:putative ABC transport system permease protein
MGVSLDSRSRGFYQSSNELQNELARRIEAGTGLRARTTHEFRWDCVRYYLANTGIPVNFGITIAIALIVGTVVAGQTFYLLTVENLKQFRALKAIGVTNRRLVGIILLQAFTVGAIGFAIGTGMAAAFFRGHAAKARHEKKVGARCPESDGFFVL